MKVVLENQIWIFHSQSILEDIIKSCKLIKFSVHYFLMESNTCRVVDISVNTDLVIYKYNYLYYYLGDNKYNLHKASASVINVHSVMNCQSKHPGKQPHTTRTFLRASFLHQPSPCHDHDFNTMDYFGLFLYILWMKSLSCLACFTQHYVCEINPCCV